MYDTLANSRVFWWLASIHCYRTVDQKLIIKIKSQQAKRPEKMTILRKTTSTNTGPFGSFYYP